MTENEIVILILGVIGAYLIGSLSCAILISKLFRLPDPRLSGSKNPGTTNVLRLGGKVPALLTLIGDVAKGWVPLFLIQKFTTNPWIISAVLVAVIVGHLFPVFFKFKGGKGVATAFGGLMGLSLALGIALIFTWLLMLFLFNYSSLSSLVTILSLPLFAWKGLVDKRYIPALIIIALLILWRHKENIYRLIKGKESKTTFKSKTKG